MDYKRIPGESGVSYADFQAYLKSAKPRRLDALPRVVGKSLSYIKKLSARWHWKARARVYDSTVLERTLEGELKGIEKAASKCIVSRKQWVDSLLGELYDKVLTAIKEDKFRPVEMARLFVDLLKLGVTKEELSVKLDECREVMDLSVLTDEELAQVDNITRKLHVN